MSKVHIFMVVLCKLNVSLQLVQVWTKAFVHRQGALSTWQHPLCAGIVLVECAVSKGKHEAICMLLQSHCRKTRG